VLLELQHANHIDFHIDSKIAKEEPAPVITLASDDAKTLKFQSYLSVTWPW
jgi:hypothetical protein